LGTRRAQNSATASLNRDVRAYRLHPDEIGELVHVQKFQGARAWLTGNSPGTEAL
jgi:hypothetical protein